MIMRHRDPSHYMNMNTRCNSLILGYKIGSEVLCMNMHLFGVVGKVSSIDHSRGIVKVEFDKEAEESKIHDPFFGQTILKD